MSEQQGQSIIDAFFQALALMKLTRCQELLQALALLAQQEPAYQPWCTYFSGVLANEYHRDWAEGERIFSALLTESLELPLQGRVMIALGRTYEYQGRWSKALDIYEQCLSIFAQPDRALDRAIIWRNMAIALEKGFTQREFDDKNLLQAVTYCNLALETLQTLETADQVEAIAWNTAATWNTLGLVYYALGDWTQATQCYERLITLGYAQNNHYGIGVATHNLGEVLHRQGASKWPEALQAYLKALELFRAIKHTYEEINVLTNLGSLHQDKGEIDTALAYYEQAISLAESIRVRQTAPSAQADYRTTIEKLYAAPLSLYLQQGDAARAFSAAERARSRVLADLLAGQTEKALPHETVPSHLLEQRTRLHQLLDEAYAAEETPDSLPSLEASLADIDRQIELLDPTYAGLESVAALTAAEIQARLPPEAAILAFVGDRDDRLWIMTVTAADVQAKLVKQVAVTWLKAYLADHIDGIHQGTLVPDPQTSHLSPPLLFSQLYQTLLKPVWDTLQAVETVYIIPFGPLHYLPLGAVGPDLTSPPPLLYQGRRVIYAPSATILFNYCHTRPASAQQGLLAIAPEDDQLQFTLDGAIAITQQAEDEALLGVAATREAFLTKAGRYQTVCFLGHGYFDPRYPMSSRLLLADGSLHANEILRELRLAADLVILSACETGRTHVLRGDEILGLSRALLYAGTPSLLATLWPVHELPTRILIEKFISQAQLDSASALAASQCWLRTLTYREIEALMAAWPKTTSTQIETILTALWQMTHPRATPQPDSRLFAHPFFWSAFILIGEGTHWLS